MAISHGKQITFFNALNTRARPSAVQITSELTFGAGVGVLDTQAILQSFYPEKFRSLSPLLGGHAPMMVAWNGIDAVCNLKKAADMYRNENYFHPQKKLMIALNLAASVNLLVLTDSYHSGAYLGIGALGVANFMAAPAFAFASLCELGAAVTDFYYSTEKGFLKMMVDRADFIENKMKKLRNTSSSTDDISGEVLEQYYHLLQEQKALLHTIKCQFVHYKLSKKKFVLQQEKKLADIFKENLLLFEEEYTHYRTDNYREVHLEIEQARQAIHSAHTCQLMIKTLSFSGMFLQALPHILILAGVASCVPFLNFISLGILTAVALMYIYNQLVKTAPSQGLLGGQTELGPCLLSQSIFSPKSRAVSSSISFNEEVRSPSSASFSPRAAPASPTFDEGLEKTGSKFLIPGSPSSLP